jgi:signal transduction histidine kinase
MPAGCEPRGRVVLPPLADAEAARAVLAPPRLPDAAAAEATLAVRAAAVAAPVVLVAPAGAGRLLLARALHTLGGRPGPLVACPGRRPPLADVPAGGSVHVEIGRLAPEALLALEALLDDGTVWVLGALAPGDTPPPALAARLGVVTLVVPPLAERPEAIAALAEATLATLARRRGGTPQALAPGALARLAGHAWPGDVGELEAVVTRAALGAGDTIGAEDLALDADPARAPAEPQSPAVSGAELEYLLAELAHELRNPMVTIKTYADHLPALLEDAELRARFAQLTGEAIARMDGLLDNLTAFARLGPPHPQPIEVAPLLERVLAEAQPDLEGRQVRVERSVEHAGRCAADPEHLAYALRNLFAGVVREVPAREEVVADATANGVVTLRFAAAGATLERLRRLAAPGDAPDLGDPTLLPLSFRLARAVLERNGGSLAVMPGTSGATTLVVNLPVGNEGRV